ncbi:ArsB/NhaD family transporter [bacterium]|nr:ArsB/NhaD family transporter [bacterium]
MENLVSWMSANSILVNTIILVIAYFFIVWEKVPKVTVALLGAGASLLTAVLITHHTGVGLGDYYSNFLGQVFNVIFLLVAMMIVVNISARSGMYTFVAEEIVKRTKGHPKTVFFALAFFTAFVSAFLDNVTTVILVMPITYAVCKMLDINPICFLITEILASNIGGTATLIGDPPNIIIGAAANFSFMDFINALTLVIFIIFFVTTFLLMFLFRKQLVKNPEKMSEVSKIDTSKTITDKPLAIRSCFVLGFIILGFVTHDMTHIPAFLIAMIAASFLLLFEDVDAIFEKVEWNTIFFFIGLFLLIGGVEASGAIGLVGDWLLKVTQGSQSITTDVILWGSAIVAGIIGNIPYTTALAPVIASIEAVKGPEYVHPIWWALSLGACLGGNITAIGAAANVIVIQSAARNGYTITFMQFLKYGASMTLLAIIISHIYLHVRYLMG